MANNNVTTEALQRALTSLGNKINDLFFKKNQGVANKDKYLQVGATGDVEMVDLPDFALKSDLPTKTSDLTNDGATGASPYAEIKDLPTKLSDLTNDNNTVQDAFYVHTDNNYTTPEKNKLADIESDAQVNIIEDVKVNGTSLPISSKSVNVPVPTDLKDLADDPTHRLVTDTDKSYWSGKADVVDIPTNVSQLINDSGYITIVDVPTDVSAFNNDAGYITSAALPTKTSDLTNDGASGTSPYAEIVDIPTNVSQLTNDSGYITLVDVPTNVSAFNNDAGYITNSDVPTNVSAFNNDAGYITSAALPTKVSDLTNDAGYITSAAVPTKTSDLTNDSNFVSDASYVHTDNNYTSADKALVAGAVQTSQIGVANGVAELDSDGKVPSSQLPSYVDDVEEYPDMSSFPAVGESDKIYVALDTNKTYRWGGSTYVIIGSDLALGDTSSTAYRGDHGKIAYDDSQLNKAHIGDLSNLKTATKTDLVSAINEIGGGSNSLGENITAAIDVGGIDAGDTFVQGTSYDDMWNALLNPTLYPALTAPSASLTYTASTYYEVGTSIPAATGTVTLNRGSINPAYGTSGYRSGAATGYALASSGADVEYSDSNSTGTFSVSALKRSAKGNIVLTATASYAAGEQPKDSKGNNYNSPLPAGSVSTTKTMQFIQAYFYGKSLTPTISDFSGLSKDVTTKGEKKFSYTTNNEYMVIAYDSSYGNLKTILDQNGFDVTSGWTKSTMTVDGFSYNVYVANSPTTDTNAQFTFKY